MYGSSWTDRPMPCPVRCTNTSAEPFRGQQVAGGGVHRFGGDAGTHRVDGGLLRRLSTANWAATSGSGSPML